MKIKKDCQNLTEAQENIVDMLAMPDAASIDFEVVKLQNEIYQKEESLFAGAPDKLR